MPLSDDPVPGRPADAPLRHLVRGWYHRYFSDPQALILALLLLTGLAVVLLLGGLLTPVVASIVLAYVLEALVLRLVRLGLPRVLAVWLVFLLFLGALLVAVFALLPLLWRQLIELVQQLPEMVSRGNEMLATLPERYPNLVTAAQIDELASVVRGQLRDYGQMVVSTSVSTITTLLVLLVYVVVVRCWCSSS